MEGIEPVIIEIAGQDPRHPWVPEENPPSPARVTLMASAYHNATPREISLKVREKLAEVDPDVVIVASYDTPPMRAAARWAKSNGRATIVSFGTTRQDRKRWWWKEWVKSWFIRRYFDAAIAPGTPHRQYLVGLGMPNNFIWGPSEVVDNAYFAEEAQKIRSDEGSTRKRLGLPERYFLYVGRMSPEKNLYRLLEAYGRCQATESNGWGLVMVGDGPDYNGLRDASERMGLRAVVWPGFKQLDELPAYYALSNGFVLPSSVEAWGLVVNEAMACGLPVLVSSQSGCAVDLVEEGGNGFTFDHGDVPGLVAHMDRLIAQSDHERLMMGRRSEEIIANYSLEAWAEGLQACIRQTMSLEDSRRRGTKRRRSTV